MKTVDANGARIPAIGPGTFQLSGETCRTMVARGTEDRLPPHRHCPGPMATRRAVGAGIRDSGVRREEIFLTTKIWPDDFRADALKRSMDQSLKRLGHRPCRPDPAALAVEGRAAGGDAGGAGRGARGRQDPAWRHLQLHRRPDPRGGRHVADAAGHRPGRISSVHRPGAGAGRIAAAWDGADRLRPDRPRPGHRRTDDRGDRETGRQDRRAGRACVADLPGRG